MGGLLYAYAQLQRLFTRVEKYEMTCVALQVALTGKGVLFFNHVLSFFLVLR